MIEPPTPKSLHDATCAEVQGRIVRRLSGWAYHELMTGSSLIAALIIHAAYDVTELSRPRRSPRRNLLRDPG